MQVSTNNAKKTVGTPSSTYSSMVDIWERCRAICAGEGATKDADAYVSFDNMLIPFSESMDERQYSLFKAEAELPEICCEFIKILLGNVLRKAPTITFPDEVKDETKSKILNEFGPDGSSLILFLYNSLSEELQTGDAWVFLDYAADDLKAVVSPRLIQAESVINKKVATVEGKQVLTRLIIRGLVEKEDPDNEFHDKLVDTVWVHEIVGGKYQIRIFEAEDKPIAHVSGGFRKESKISYSFVCKETKNGFTINNKPLDYIPAWPLDGSLDNTTPMMLPLVEKEIALYNKISRRNHLLLGAATYTPIIFSDMSDESFKELVLDKGLGSWLHLAKDDKADMLKTPTDALKDMEVAIGKDYETIAKLGVRMLAPENMQPGVALALRNSSQISKLETLSNRVAEVMRQILCFMIEVYERKSFDYKNITFAFSVEAQHTASIEWAKAITDWYERKLIPRSVWVDLMRQNEIFSIDYDDEAGLKEINASSI